jgi:propanediol utilization protein
MQKLTVEIETSMRHVHLSQEHLAALFGEELTPIKALSQPGQFACAQCVTVVGPKNSIHDVRVIGPARRETQVEISITDAYALGIKNVPIRLSKDTGGSPGCTLENPENGKQITIEQGVIIAQRHIHATHEDAAAYGLSQETPVKVIYSNGQRPVVFDNVAVRVGTCSDSSFKMHIDADEANAATITYDKSPVGEIIA